MTTTNNKKSNAGRPKGSKNEFSKKDIEKLQERVNELEKSSNSYDEVIDSFIDGFIIDTENNMKTISNETLQKWFSNPDEYMKEINDLLTYYFIIDGNIGQLYDLFFSLSPLNYRIKVLERTNSYEEDMMKLKDAFERKVNHKILTREILVQTVHDGTCIGTWLGNRREPYFEVFDNLDYIYPYGKYKGKMVGVFDLSYLDSLKEEQQKAIFENLSPIVTKSKYNKYKNCNDIEKKKVYQLIVLPPETTLVARSRILSGNQRLGLPYGTQAIFDLQHKQKMKELERTIADKIIRAIALVKFKNLDEQGNKIKESTQKKVFNKVKKALEKNTNTKGGITVLAMPGFANIETPEIKNGDKILAPEKYESVDNDISKGTGVSDVLTNGTGGNFASANMNLEMIYKKIGTLLEQIEVIYNQLIIIVLGKSKGSKYLFEYDKEMPLSKKEKINVVKSLTDKGYSVKHLTDMLGIDFDELIRDSLYEIEDLKLREKIVPPLTSYTMSDKSEGDVCGNPVGGQEVDNPENENTENTKTNDGNSSPSPSDS